MNSIFVLIFKLLPQNDWLNLKRFYQYYVSFIKWSPDGQVYFCHKKFFSYLKVSIIFFDNSFQIYIENKNLTEQK